MLQRLDSGQFSQMLLRRRGGQVEGGKVGLGLEPEPQVQTQHPFLILTLGPIQGLRCQRFGNTDLV